jgi:hypothetical protein
MGGTLNDISWRTRHPKELLEKIDELVMRRLSI